jgi:hypothetical protein
MADTRYTWGFRKPEDSEAFAFRVAAAMFATGSHYSGKLTGFRAKNLVGEPIVWVTLEGYDRAVAKTIRAATEPTFARTFGTGTTGGIPRPETLTKALVAAGVPREVAPSFS